MEQDNISVKNVMERSSADMVSIENIVNTVKDRKCASTAFAEKSVINVVALNCVVIENKNHFVKSVVDLKYVSLTTKLSRAVLDVWVDVELLCSFLTRYR